MYLENTNHCVRRELKFTFSGLELAEKASKLREMYSIAEEAARKEMSRLMLDKAIAANDKAITECKNRIEQYGKLHEEAKVYAFCFAREKDRTFHLSIGDVVFFGFI